MQNKKNDIVMNKRVSKKQQESNSYIENERENIKTDLIKITKDKLENILLKNIIQITNSSDWKTPLALFITTLTSVLTSDFKDCLLSKDIGQALYLLLIICSFIWFLRSLIRTIKNPKRDVIESLINEISNIKEDDG